MNTLNKGRFTKEYTFLQSYLNDHEIISVQGEGNIHLIVPYPNEIFIFLKANNIKYHVLINRNHMLVTIPFDQFSAKWPETEADEVEWLKLESQ